MNNYKSSGKQIQEESYKWDNLKKTLPHSILILLKKKKHLICNEPSKWSEVVCQVEHNDINATFWILKIQ